MARSTTIDQESKLLSSLSIDLDRFRRLYTTKDDDKTVFFVGPSLTIFERFRFTLVSNSKRLILEEKYYQRPDYLSYDQYGTVVLWPVILYVNDVLSIEEFVLDSVLVPSFDSITDITRYNELSLKALDVQELNKEPSNKRLKSLYTSKIIPKEDV